MQRHGGKTWRKTFRKPFQDRKTEKVVLCSLTTQSKVLSRNPPLKKGDFRLFSPFGKGGTGGIFQFVNFY